VKILILLVMLVTVQTRYLVSCNSDQAHKALFMPLTADFICKPVLHPMPLALLERR